MREIKFEYVGRNVIFNEVIKQVLTLEQIQLGREILTFFAPNNDNCEMLAKRQYTGLKDKNSKEIYEGDVVNVQLHWVTDKLHTAKVVWREDQAMFMVAVDHKNDDGILFYELPKLRSILIIGNIYENKDLL